MAVDDSTNDWRLLLGADVGSNVKSVAALAEPLRRDLYRFVVTQPHPVSREEAAAGIGVPLHLAKFHLDKLVDQGLLEFAYQRPPGRGGPGAGRPAKIYRRSSVELSVSIPGRRYEFASRLLARAVSDAESRELTFAEAMQRASRSVGRVLAGEVLARARKPHRRSSLRHSLVAVLEESGYEPRVEDGRVILANCPFDSLARDYTQLACGLNLDLITGLVDAVPGAELHARLEAADGRCCVLLCER